MNRKKATARAGGGVVAWACDGVARAWPTRIEGQEAMGFTNAADQIVPASRDRFYKVRLVPIRPTRRAAKGGRRK